MPVREEKTAGTAGVVDRNIQALLARRREQDRAKGLEDRLADAITRFTGSMRFVWMHLLVFGLWILANLGWLGLEPFDPSFVMLAMVASVEAIFLSTFVLISQNRMQALADRRAELDLQVGLLAEHELTRLLGLVVRIAERMDLQEGRDPALEDLAQVLAPEQVLDKLEETERELGDRGGN